MSVIYLVRSTRNRFLSELGGPPNGSLFDLAPDGACHAIGLASDPVVSYTTFSPLPQNRLPGPAAVYFLWRFPCLPIYEKPPDL